METLTSGQARRLAVVAQGLGRPRPIAPGLRQVRATVERLGVLQIDSVSVLARSHYLPLWSRLGAYDREHLHRLAYPRRAAERRLLEVWAHEASFIPVGLEPALRWRTTEAAQRRARPAAVDRVLAAVRDRGPLAASDLEERVNRGPWWDLSESKRALEWAFAAGELLVPRRRASFEREYDLRERVLPPAVLAAPSPTSEQARRALIVQAAAALGVATERDLLDWWRLNVPRARPLVAELRAEGALRQVAVRGWEEPAYVLPGAVVPRQVTGAALLSPFDNLVFFRPRVERLWGMRVRLEIYTPQVKRTHGYYVLPFLLGDRLVARVDLKSDRGAGVLRVLAAHAEPGADEAEVVPALLGELRGLAAWVGLDQVAVVDRGDLARPLRASLDNLAAVR